MPEMFRDPVVRLALALAAVSILIWGAMWVLGATTRPDILAPDQPFRTYFQALNWWPFPVFFLAMVPVLHLTWGAFLKAWHDLSRTSVLTDQSGGAPRPAAMARLVTDINRARLWAIPIVLVAMVAVNVLDTSGDVDVYRGTATPAEQRAYACANPDFTVAWIFDQLADGPFRARPAPRSRSPGRNPTRPPCSLSSSYCSNRRRSSVSWPSPSCNL